MIAQPDLNQLYSLASIYLAFLWRGTCTFLCLAQRLSEGLPPTSALSSWPVCHCWTSWNSGPRTGCDEESSEMIQNLIVAQLQLMHIWIPSKVLVLWENMGILSWKKDNHQWFNKLNFSPASLPPSLHLHLLKEAIDLSHGESSTVAGFQRHADQAIVRAIRLAIIHIFEKSFWKNYFENNVVKCILPVAIVQGQGL